MDLRLLSDASDSTVPVRRLLYAWNVSKFVSAVNMPRGNVPVSTLDHKCSVTSDVSNSSSLAIVPVKPAPLRSIRTTPAEEQ